MHVVAPFDARRHYPCMATLLAGVDQQTSADRLREADTKRQRQTFVRRVAKIRDRVVGFGDLAQTTAFGRSPGAPVRGLRIHVETAARGRGVGSALLGSLIKAQTEPVRVAAWVQDHWPRAERFLVGRGFIELERGQEMQMEVQDYRPRALNQIERRLRERGVRIVSLEHVGVTAGLIDAIFDLDEALINDIPDGYTFPTQTRDGFEKLRFGKGHPIAGTFLAMNDDQPVGFAFINRGEDELFFGDTGVHPNFRNLGVATAIKHRACDWAFANGVTKVFTRNHVRNRGIIALNMSMGFTAKTQHILYLRNCT